MERRGRAVGVDLGTRRIGIAVSDSGGTVATPLGTVMRTGDPDRDRRTLVDLIVEEEATTVVVGLPLSLDGTRGAAATAAEAEAAALRTLLDGSGVTVELFDERLTTVTAEQSLRAAGTRGRRQRSVVDRTAAAVLLGAWLESRGPRP